MKYINYSGGASGSDYQWKEYGNKFGVETIDFTKESLSKHLNLEDEIEEYYVKTCDFLKRPILKKDSYGGKLVRRNYLQTYFSEAIFAIGDLIKPKQLDKKGFINKSQFTVVSGGTAYAVTYAILHDKPIYVFNQDIEKWFTWNSEKKDFIVCDIPILTKTFAGIGTREISLSGLANISKVYKKTFFEI